MKAGHYLVHKPTLELRDIPLFNALFLHATSPQDIGECEWLLRVLGGGLRCEEDYRLYQRKRVLPHLLALYTGLSLDSKTRVTCLSFYWAFSKLKTRVTCPYRYFYWAFSEVHTLAAKLKRLSPPSPFNLPFV
jgi:hypothetical protein